MSDVKSIYEDYLPNSLTTLYTHPEGAPTQEIRSCTLNNQNTTTEVVNLQIIRGGTSPTVSIGPKDNNMAAGEYDDDMGIGLPLFPGDVIKGSTTTASKVFCAMYRGRMRE